jgi:hypothetical protein
MNHGNGKNLIEPAGNIGIDPETAANDIRAILAASGKGSKMFAQRGALLEWAEKAARRYRESFWIAEARIGGLEHLVWNDAENQLIRKATYGGSFGRTVRFLDRGPSTTNCSEPLQKSPAFWKRQTAIFRFSFTKSRSWVNSQMKDRSRIS